MKKLLVTGGAGFIGSHFVRLALAKGYKVYNLDNLTYSGNMETLKDVEGNENHIFVKGDICDPDVVGKLMQKVDYVAHLAAESHVDNSIIGPMVFTKTNVLGTHILLELARKHDIQRFVYISTDEVYGSVEDGFSKEDDLLEPNSPYSASKTAGDLMARAYYQTYKFPVMVTRGCNNYGPYQYPEKLIPLFIINLMDGKKVPVYGAGTNVREWIHVTDHCKGIMKVLEEGQPGEVYNLGSGEHKQNIEVTKILLKTLGRSEEFIEYVTDRLGHDIRYAIDSSKLRSMGWQPEINFTDGIAGTVKWFQENEWWWRPLKK